MNKFKQKSSVIDQKFVKPVRKQSLAQILAQEKITYATRSPMLQFPFVFKYVVPMDTYNVIDLASFFCIKFEQIDYVFDYTTAKALLPFIIDLDSKFNVHLKTLSLMRLTLIRKVAYHIVSINNMILYYRELVNDGCFTTTIDAMFHVLQHLMQLEEILSIHRDFDLNDITITEGHSIIGNIKRKVWSFFILLQYTPKMFIQIVIETLSYFRQYQIDIAKDNTEVTVLPDAKIKLFTNLRLKADRLLRDFISFYLNKVKHYPDYTPSKYKDDFLCEDNFQAVILLKENFPNLLPLYIRHDLSNNILLLVNVEKEP